MKIKNRSRHKRSRRLDGIGVRRIRTFTFLPLMIYWKPDCRCRNQKRKDKPITIHVPKLCDWFGSSASASDSDDLVFTRSKVERKRWDLSRVETLFSLGHKLYPFCITKRRAKNAGKTRGTTDSHAKERRILKITVLGFQSPRPSQMGILVQSFSTFGKCAVTSQHGELEISSSGLQTFI